MPDHQPDGFDLERVLTLMQGDISRIKTDVHKLTSGMGNLRSDVHKLTTDVADLKTGQDTLIDSVADTTARVVELERTQHQH